MSTKITEKYSFNTDIITSYDGHEQRLKTRQYPRRLVSYDYDAMAPEEAQWLRAQLRMRQSDTVYVPMWHRPVRLASNFYGGKFLYIDQRDFFGLYGAEAVEIFHYDDVMGAKDINVQKKIAEYDYTSSSITLKTNLDRQLNRFNTWIYPLVKCNTQPTDNFNYVFSNGASVVMNFEDVLYDSGIPLPTEVVLGYDYENITQFNRFKLPEKYLDKDVLLNNPQWDIDDTSILSITKNVERVDNTSGIFKYDLKNSMSYDSHKFIFLLRNRVMIDNIIKFFKNHAGMYKSFWCPSWVNDFNVIRDIVSGTNEILVSLSTLHMYYINNNRKKRIVIFTNDWESYIYEISGYSQFIEQSTGIRYGKVSLSSSIEKGIPLSNLRMISYFNLVRFDSDELQIDYESDEVATVNVVVKEVDDLDGI